MKITRFDNIEQITTTNPYAVDVGFRSLEHHLKGYADDQGLELDPDFQRGHVWSEEQQIGYTEWALQGGLSYSGRNILFNSATLSQPVQLVDGLQRLTAIRRFLANEFPVFGSYYNEFEDKLPIHCRFNFTVNNLQTRAEVLRWYLKLNAGGTVHSGHELDRVRTLLAAEETA